MINLRRSIVETTPHGALCSSITNILWTWVEANLPINVAIVSVFFTEMAGCFSFYLFIYYLVAIIGEKKRQKTKKKKKKRKKKKKKI